METTDPTAGGAPGRTASAVLVPVFRDGGGELRLLLVVRGPGGLHGDQLGLPGGKREPGDATLLETALREAEEEVGLAREAIEVVAALEPLDARSSGFRVHPFLARIVPPETWRLAAGEIAGIVTPRVTDLAGRTTRAVTSPGWPEPRSVPCVILDGDLILWGLTLRLLAPLVPRLLADEWAL